VAESGAYLKSPSVSLTESPRLTGSEKKQGKRTVATDGRKILFGVYGTFGWPRPNDAGEVCPRVWKMETAREFALRLGKKRPFPRWGRKPTGKKGLFPAISPPRSGQDIVGTVEKQRGGVADDRGKSRGGGVLDKNEVRFGDHVRRGYKLMRRRVQIRWKEKGREDRCEGGSLFKKTMGGGESRGSSLANCPRLRQISTTTK